MEEIVRECATLEEDFRTYGDELEEFRMIFDSTWDEQIQRIYAEQEVFQSQVVCGNVFEIYPFTTIFPLYAF